ncbi:hypothetical protein BKA70DRAFT_1370048 [Coprinopsis sp. MPI-PUGE-AT-0042]|nr:hypothetical protein BKA70DRAFT_1370048 [Coprinopsis sp. MPI-PUGE-AT-0042]
MLDLARSSNLEVGDTLGITDDQVQASAAWRARVREVQMMGSPVILRRAHVVLAFLLHFYVQTLPPLDPVVIPRSISLPILRVSKALDIPALLTFFRHFEFYLCSARIELRGTLDEMFVGDAIAVRRISDYLKTMAGVVAELKTLLLDVRMSCDPEIYYNGVRPWFRGEDSDMQKRPWLYEGSSLVHVLDVFLGVDHQSKSGDKPSFMSRMLTYMPRNHRLFLKHLSASPRPLRDFVVSSGDQELLETYNKTVLALKEFRDAHMIIATLYIVGPARRAAKAAAEALLGREIPESREPLKGTGGTDLVQFLKDTRNRTGATMISVQ